MARLPADLETLRLLYQTAQQYTAALDSHVAIARGLILDFRLAERLGEAVNDLPFPERKLNFDVGQPPRLLNNYAVASQGLLDAHDKFDAVVAEVEPIATNPNRTPAEIVFAIHSLLPLWEGLQETYGDLGSRLLRSIEEVSAGRPPITWPNKPPHSLTGIKLQLFDAIWELANWSTTPIKANSSEVTERVWGDELVQGTRLNPQLSKMNNAVCASQIDINFRSVDGGASILIELPRA